MTFISNPFKPKKTPSTIKRHERPVPQKYNTGPVVIGVTLNQDGYSEPFKFRNKTVIIRVHGFGAFP